MVSLLLGVVILGFGAYYYYDRYYSPKPKTMDLAIQKAEQALVLDPKNADKRLDLAQADLADPGCELCHEGRPSLRGCATAKIFRCQ